MTHAEVVLINSNDMRPPVAPIALDYLAGALYAAGVAVRVVDLAFAQDTEAAIASAFSDAAPRAVGISFRNTDDCFWPSGDFFVPRLRRLVAQVRTHTDAPIVLGGCGFGIFPRAVMDACGVDLGIVGDGEGPLVELVRRLRTRTPPEGVPGLAVRDGSRRVAIAPTSYPDALSSATARAWVDNIRYFREGGMGNVETKRGCPGRCIYCADPLGKGVRSRCRPPAEVADEVEALCTQGVDVLHICDSEFNLPAEHALAVCEEMTRRGLGRNVRWYCYAAISPFTERLAHAMRGAGCVGINFGADSACDRMLAALGRHYTRVEIGQAVRACRAAGITVMLDLLLGGPGENETSVGETVEYIKAVDPDRAGAALGVRVYPGTELAHIVAAEGPMATNPNLRGTLVDNEEFFLPVFYIDRALGQDPAGLVADAIGADPRFFLPAGGDAARDYNYSANEILTRAIAAGARGAFWDILRRL